jgi:ADP-dependent NAD(P)H-hydrate dehydratase
MDDAVVVTPHLLREWPLPEAGSDKHARGSTLLVAGSRNTPGAAALRAESVLRVGGGKVQVATSSSSAGVVAQSLPEALVRGFPETESGDVSGSAAPEVAEMAQHVSVALLGPGLLDPANTVALLEGVVPHLDQSIVIDALGSAFVTRHRDGLHHLDGRGVLTLNPTELGKTLDVAPEEVDEDPLGATRELAESARVVVICGGTVKLVVAPNGAAHRISGGGPGLAVSGSGDVQAGLVSGLLARGADPLQAAVWGAFLHAAAGDRLAEQVGPIGFLARELPAVVPSLLVGLQA